MGDLTPMTLRGGPTVVNVYCFSRPTGMPARWQGPRSLGPIPPGGKERAGYADDTAGEIGQASLMATCDDYELFSESPPRGESQGSRRRSMSAGSYSPQRLSDFSLEDAGGDELESASGMGEAVPGQRPSKRIAVGVDRPSFAVPSEPLVQTSFGANADAAFWSLPKREEVLLPWESGIMREIFGASSTLPRLPWDRPEVPHLFPESAASSASVAQGSLTKEKAVHEVHFARLVSLAVNHSDEVANYESKRFKAVSMWLRLIDGALRSFPLREQLMDARHKGAQEDEILEVVDDVCAMKAPGTLEKRAGALLRFAEWCRVEGFDSGLPPEEPTAYLYVKHLASLPYTTTAKSFREALAFARHVLGFAGLEPVLESKRIEGVSRRLAFEAGGIKQASPLSLRQLKHLECLVGECKQAFDRYSAGCFLMAVLGRCRWSDFRFLESISFDDPGFIEMSTKHHKTALMFHKRNKLLPISVPLVSFGGREGWWHDWKLAAGVIGVEFDRRPFGPLLPAPVDAATLGRCAVTTAEATELLRSFLRPVDEPRQCLSSHSCKATLLSWCAKAGLSQEDREVLGRHCGSVKSTSAVYSRDLQAAALAGLGDVLLKVRRGEFDPSAPRSLRWKPVVEVKSEAEVADVVSDEEAVSLSESGADDVDHDLGEAAVPTSRAAWRGGPREAYA